MSKRKHAKLPDDSTQLIEGAWLRRAAELEAGYKFLSDIIQDGREKLAMVGYEKATKAEVWDKLTILIMGFAVVSVELNPERLHIANVEAAEHLFGFQELRATFQQLLKELKL